AAHRELHAPGFPRTFRLRRQPQGPGGPDPAMNGQPIQSRRLEPIQRLAQGREDDAARRLAESQRALERQEAQLRDMQRYLDEYSASPGGLLTPSLLANREAFLRQLAEALRWQAGAVGEARNRLELARQHWVGRHRDTDVVERLLE